MLNHQPTLLLVQRWENLKKKRSLYHFYIPEIAPSNKNLKENDN